MKPFKGVMSGGSGAIMKCTALAVVLLALATACGSSSHNTGSSVASSIAGSWNVGLTEKDGGTVSFQATLVSEEAVNGRYDLSCNLSTQAGVITQALLNLTGCYVADCITDQCSFPPQSAIFTPQAVLIETVENSSDIMLIVAPLVAVPLPENTKKLPNVSVSAQLDVQHRLVEHRARRSAVPVKGSTAFGQPTGSCGRKTKSVER